MWRPPPVALPLRLTSPACCWQSAIRGSSPERELARDGNRDRPPDAKPSFGSEPPIAIYGVLRRDGGREALAEAFAEAAIRFDSAVHMSRAKGKTPPRTLLAPLREASPGAPGASS